MTNIWLCLSTIPKFANKTALYSVVKDGVLADKELKQTQKRYFQILYNMLLGKDQGPKLGLFLMAIDKEKITSLL